MDLSLASRPPASWDEFVREHPDGSPFHLSAWSQCVHDGLGWPARFVVATQDGDVVGGLPLHHVRSRLFGTRLASTPQAAYGGPLAADARVFEALVSRAAEEAERLGVDYMELRTAQVAAGLCEGERWRREDLRVTLGGPIAADDDAIEKAIPKKTRADCRKSDAAVTASESAEHFETFRALFAENQHRLGTPVLPARFLRLVAEHPDLGPRILVAEHDGRPVAACLSFSFGERILPYYAGAVADAREQRPNHGLYLNVLRFARRAGCTYFDFGRSKKGSGSYDFKRRWGFAETPLDYRFRLVRGAAMPSLNPANPSYRRKIEAWKRLPGWAANAIGPLLSPGLS